MEGRRNITLQNNPSTDVAWIWSGDRRNQGFGVRMQGLGINGICISNLNNFTQVHYSNPIAYVSHHGKIVSYENIGKLHFTLKF
jgi:hypothetical protein